MILAAIDIGTNTLRLLIAHMTAGAFREIHSDRRITRLGQNLSRSGRLSADAVRRSTAVLSEFAESAARFRTDHVAAVGTSALRNASNAVDFVEAVRKATGIEIKVISGDEEARFTLLGVTKAVHIRSRPAFVIDIGGGSTELILAGAGGRVREISLPLGAVYLTEQLFKGDPPAADEMEQARLIIRGELDKHEWLKDASADMVLVGTAGTVTTLAAMNLELADYDPDRINGATLQLEWIGSVIRTLGSTTIQERHKIRGLEPGREDIILAGAVICQEIMGRFGFKQMLVSDWGLREGILFDLHQRIQRKACAEDTAGMDH